VTAQGPQIQVTVYDYDKTLEVDALTKLLDSDEPDIVIETLEQYDKWRWL